VDHDEPTPCSFAEEGGWYDGHEQHPMLYRCQSVHPAPEEYGVNKVSRHHPEEHSTMSAWCHFYMVLGRAK
jgi:hypothetical protein